MSTRLTVTRPFHVRQGARGRREMEQGEARTAEAAARVPRVSRLMALAIRFDGLIRDGVVTDQAELARLGHVTRARLTQIMNLLNLAPDIQEEVLFCRRRREAGIRSANVTVGPSQPSGIGGSSGGCGARWGRGTPGSSPALQSAGGRGPSLAQPQNLSSFRMSPGTLPSITRYSCQSTSDPRKTPCPLEGSYSNTHSSPYLLLNREV